MTFTSNTRVTQSTMSANYLSRSVFGSRTVVISNGLRQTPNGTQTDLPQTTGKRRKSNTATVVAYSDTYGVLCHDACARTSRRQSSPQFNGVKHALRRALSGPTGSSSHCPGPKGTRANKSPQAPKGPAQLGAQDLWH